MRKTSKTILVATVVLFTTLPASAGDHKPSVTKTTKNISTELFGSSNGIGLHYDSRLKGNNGWGYSAGLAWGYSKSSNLFNSVEQYHLISFVPRMNYLLGKKKSKLELGIGTNIGYLIGKNEYDIYDIKEKGGYKYHEYAGHVKEKKILHLLYFRQHRLPTAALQGFHVPCRTVTVVRTGRQAHTRPSLFGAIHKFREVVLNKESKFMPLCFHINAKCN